MAVNFVREYDRVEEGTAAHSTTSSRPAPQVTTSLGQLCDSKEKVHGYYL